MLASPCRQLDLETYVICTEILDRTVQIYKKVSDTDIEVKNRYEAYIKAQADFVFWIKEKIDNYDYTEDDKKYWAIHKLLSPTGK